MTIIGDDFPQPVKRRPEEKRSQLQKCFGLANGFLGLSDGDQLVPSRLGSTIPGLVEKGHGCARRQVRPDPLFSGLMRRKFGRMPHSLEGRRAAAFQLFTGGSNFLKLFTERIDGRVRVFPGVDEGVGIEGTDELAHVIQFEQFGACRNEQADGELDGVTGLHQIETMQLLEEIEAAFYGGPWAKRDESGLKSKARAEAIFDDAKKIRPGGVFVELAQHGIVKRFHRRDDKKAAGLAEDGQEIRTPQEVFDFDGYVVGEPGKFAVQGFDKGNGVACAIKEIGITEGNVLGPSRNLLANIRENDVAINDTKNAVVYRNDRAMAAEMLAAAARFGIPDGAVFTRRQNEMRVGTKRRKIGTVRSEKAEARQRNL